mgnify:CR=1 FL=1
MKQRLAEEAHERGKAEIELKWTGVVVQMKCLIRNNGTITISWQSDFKGVFELDGKESKISVVTSFRAGKGSVLTAVRGIRL